MIETQSRLIQINFKAVQGQKATVVSSYKLPTAILSTILVITQKGLFTQSMRDHQS